MRRNLIVVGLLLAVLGDPAAAEINLLPDRIGPLASMPFSDVPRSHPSYAVGHHLASLGLPFGMDGGGGNRALTRYEFAVSAQRIHSELRRVVGALSARKTLEAGQPELRKTLADPQRLDEALNWLTPMIQEYAPELRLLGDDAEKRLKEVNLWRREAPDLTRRVRETQAIPSPAVREAGAARGPFADLGETHPLTHPCYATADYVSELLAGGRLVEVMRVSSNLLAVDRSRANIAWLRALTHEYKAELELLPKTRRSGP